MGNGTDEATRSIGFARGMIDRRMILLGASAVPLSFGALGGAVRAATGSETSAVASTGHARIRLIDGGPLPGAEGIRLVGLRIELDPSYLTYWRSPGNAGVPPSVDTTGSVNVRSVDLRFPAPGLFDEGGSQVFGYREGVILPLLAAPLDTTHTVDLQVALSFAICAAQCLPAAGTMRLRLEGAGVGLEADLVRAALDRVPVPRALGQHGPLTIERVSPGPTPGTASVSIMVAEGGMTPVLFVEAPDPWFVTADPATPDGAGRYTVGLRVLAGAAEPARVPVRLTLVTPAHAIDVTADLDLAWTKP